MTKTCRNCSLEKPISEFHFRKDNESYRSECKECWKYRQAANRLGISFDQAKQFYKQPTCLCCGENFKTKRDHHLHHVNNQVKGVLCHYCNTAVGQETDTDLHRIKACVNFMLKPRENLFDRVNQQGSLENGILSPSTISRQISCNQRQCKFCKRILPLNRFYKQKYVSGKYGYYAACKECHKIYTKTYKFNLTFDQVQILRATTRCECCEEQFTSKQFPYIHHIGDKVLGVVCRRCNSLLEQESDLTKLKLNACLAWLTR
jgi:hypothetical protein